MFYLSQFQVIHNAIIFIIRQVLYNVIFKIILFVLHCEIYNLEKIFLAKQSRLTINSTLFLILFI